MKKASRRLVLVRHARAEQVGATDQERELTPAGLRDAAAAGRWLAEAGTVPDHALVSAARRTRQTWEALAGSAGWQLEPELSTALYAAGPDAALDLLRELPEQAATAVVVGHNPTVAFLAQLLSDGSGEDALLREMSQGYPPGALTVLDLPGSWDELDAASARVVGFHVGRG